MQIETELSIRQTQKLALTPQMEQALTVLQMGSEELNQCIEEEVLSNPMLDYARTEERREIKRSYEERSGGYGTGGNKDQDGQSYLNAIADDRSYDTELKEYLKMQLLTKGLARQEQRKVEYLIECLEESGYLKMNVVELAKGMGISKEEAEEKICFLQGFEPRGVCARDLKECLLLQLDGRDERTMQVRALIEDHLDEIAQNKLPQISKETGLSIEEITGYIRYIKKELEPIPGRGYGREERAFIYPDVTVKQEDGEYRIILNRERIRPLELNKEYLPMLSQKHSTEEDAYIQEQYQKARIFMKNIGKREETLWALSEALVDWQREFFEKGRAYLKPMNLLDIAQELGIHESTVSRAVKDKYLECRWGIFEMKYFFSNKTSDGNNCNVRSRVEEVIRGEDKKKPLSDARIAAVLEEQGIRISRRTVTKYREQLQIPNTQMRREYR